MEECETRSSKQASDSLPLIIPGSIIWPIMSASLGTVPGLRLDYIGVIKCGVKDYGHMRG
jgi:hypothetical protein